MKSLAILLVCCFAASALSRTYKSPPCMQQKNCAESDWEETSEDPLASSELDMMPLRFHIKRSNLDKVEEVALGKVGTYLTFNEYVALVRNEKGTSMIRKWIQSVEGMKITEISAAGDYIWAEGTPQAVAKLFNTQLKAFRSAQQKVSMYRAHQIHVPTDIGEQLDYVHGVVNFPATLVKGPVISAFPQPMDAELRGYVTPHTLFNLYNVPNTPVVGHTNQTVFEDAQQFSPQDLELFQRHFRLAPTPISHVFGRGNFPSLCLKPLQQAAQYCGEATLDVQYITAMGQGADSYSISYDSRDFGGAIARAAAQPHNIHVQSISYGARETQFPEEELRATDQDFMVGSSRGVSFIVASGDDGVAGRPVRNDPSQCGFFPSFPASSNWITSVGATQGPEAGKPETVCEGKHGGVITSGGGFSDTFEQKAWQSSQIRAYLKRTGSTHAPSNAFSGGNRGYPDVTALGHNYITVIQGKGLPVSGTSASAPVFAGMVTRINGKRRSMGKGPLGFLNKALYSSTLQGAYNDITQGENNCGAQPSARVTAPVCCKYGFHATAGWDATSGLGSPDFAKMEQALVNM